MRFTVLVALAFSLLAASVSGEESPPTTGATEVGDFLREIAVDVSGEDGQWTARYRGARILVFAVEEHGRMRIMAPITSTDSIGESEMRFMLDANYARALDAKFAIQDGVVWSLFNRPLVGLDRETFVDGADQVVTLRKNYGTSYRSTDLTFGRPEGG